MRATPLKIICYVPTFNAGDTTRGIEVTRALEARAAQAGRELDILFVCPPIKVAHFEALILKAGYRIAHTAVPLSQADIDNFMNADRNGEEFIPDYDRAKLYIEKYMENLKEHRPDLLINGCIPPAGVAARILGIPTVTYFPFPADKAWVERYFLKDIPDQLENALTLRLPPYLRAKLTRLLSKLATKQRFFTQPTLARAGRELGWQEPSPGIFTMLRADVELVNDLPIFYEGQELGPRTRITGPLFSKGADAAIDPRILDIFAPANPNKVLVTMGSSGEKKHLLEAIAAVVEAGYHAVVVVQPTICLIAEVRARLHIPAHVYLTDAFIPAHLVNPLADAVIIHGGQGTVQNAMFSGTPFVGVGMQAEQQTNLDNFSLQGAGIRLSKKLWKRAAIREALGRVLAEPKFKANAMRMAQNFSAIDGYKEAGNAIWELVESRKL